MRRVVVTGLGFITSIGNGQPQVLESLRTQRSGIEVHPELDRPEIPVKLAGTVKGFQFPAENPESWKLPSGLTIPRVQLRGMPPHGVFAYAAMREAIDDAQLSRRLSFQQPHRNVLRLSRVDPPALSQRGQDAASGNSALRSAQRSVFHSGNAQFQSRLRIQNQRRFHWFCQRVLIFGARFWFCLRSR